MIALLCMGLENSTLYVVHAWLIQQYTLAYSLSIIVLT
jgi:hypothetical protein